MSRYLEASLISCVGLATAWKLFCRWVQACRCLFAMLLLDPSTSALINFSQGDCDGELNESSKRSIIDWMLSCPWCYCICSRILSL